MRVINFNVKYSEFLILILILVIFNQELINNLVDFYRSKAAKIISCNFDSSRYTAVSLRSCHSLADFAVPLFRVTIETRRANESSSRALVFITQDGFAMEISRTWCFKRRDRRKSTSNSPLSASSTLFDQNARMHEMRSFFATKKNCNRNNEVILLRKVETIIIIVFLKKVFSEKN